MTKLKTHRQQKIKNKKNLYKKTNKKRTYGGKALASGSYGCVFDSLKCQDNKYPYNPNHISKLMYKNDAVDEMEEMRQAQQIVNNIPNYDKFFLLSNITLCNPAPLSPSDLENFDNECELFTQSHNNENIFSSTVNMNLDKLMLINMPNGGKSVKQMFKLIYSEENDKLRKSLFITLNNSLMNLLQFGIVPLNQAKFNHFDIKDDNILFGPDKNSRLIDWSLASANDGITIPKAATNRSIHFNMPVSLLLFNTFIKDFIKKSYAEIKVSANLGDTKAGQKEFIKMIALNLLNVAMRPPKDDSHFRIIVDRILHSIYKLYMTEKENVLIDYKVLTNNVIIEYIEAVLIKYVDINGNFDDVRYFYEVFQKNADIWGFLLSYSSVIERGYDKFPKDFINGLCRIFIKYCFSPEFAATPIDINSLLKDLTSLNSILRSSSLNTKKNKSKIHSVKRLPYETN